MSLPNLPRRTLFLIATLIGVLALSAVLAFTVLRVQNEEPTVSQPQAASCEDQVCRPVYDACVSACADSPTPDDCRNTCQGDLNGCISTQCGAGGQGCTDGRQACRVSYCGNPNPAGSNCYDEYCGVKKPAGSVATGGQCHYDDECSSNNCSTAGDNSCAVGQCIAAGGGNNGGGNNNGTNPPPNAQTGTGGAITVLIKSSSGGNYPSAGKVRMNSTSACASCNSACQDPVCQQREMNYVGGSGSVRWPTSSAGANYTFSFPGFSGTCSTSAGGTCTITVGAGVNSGGPVTVYVKDQAGNNYNQAAVVRMTGTSSCTSCNAGCSDPVCNPNRERNYAAGSGSVKWDTSRVGATYNFAILALSGANCTAPAGGSCIITVGGTGATHLECKNNACAKVAGGGNNKHGCTTEGAACTTGATHLECKNNACAKVAGGGGNKNGCTTEGAACTSGTVSHLTCGSNNTCQRVNGAGTDQCLSEGSTCGQVNACWGNNGVNGRCYDVNGDAVINILDFSCLSNLWLSNITPSSDPKCGRGAGVDLVVTSFEVDSPATKGSSVEVEVAVSNLGEARAGAFRVAVDNDNEDEEFTCQVGTKSVEVSVPEGLAPGGTKIVTLQMPTPTTAGSYVAAALVDSTCSFSEGSEDDNVEFADYTVQ